MTGRYATKRLTSLTHDSPGPGTVGLVAEERVVSVLRVLMTRHVRRISPAT